MAQRSTAPLASSVPLSLTVTWAFHGRQYFASSDPSEIGFPQAKTSATNRSGRNCYAFFFRAAQRFRIASAKRSLPAGVIPTRFFPDVALGEVGILEVGIFAVDDLRPFPSSASIARLTRSLSIFKSATIFATSKARSFFGHLLTG
jgi:hypothetical protein